jgi:hypothetical protein
MLDNRLMSNDADVLIQSGFFRLLDPQDVVFAGEL